MVQILILSKNESANAFISLWDAEWHQHEPNIMDFLKYGQDNISFQHCYLDCEQACTSVISIIVQPLLGSYSTAVVCWLKSEKNSLDQLHHPETHST